MRNKPLIYLLAMAGTICLGLATRTSQVASFVPSFVGDGLYAVMIYFGLCIFFHRQNPLKIALLAFVFCTAIEFSQLLSWPWLQSVRGHKIGRLILGQGFLGSDILAYAVGIVAAWQLDLLFWLKRGENRSKKIRN